MFSLAKILENIFWYGDYRPDIGHCRHHLWPGEEGLVCEEPIENLPPPCGEKLLSLDTVRKGEYGGKYKVINCEWA